MTAFFFDYLQAGILGSIIVVLIVLLRLMLRNAPRKIICLLWFFAAIRLLLPFHIESNFSLQPQLPQFSSLPISNQVSDSVPSQSVSADTTVTPIAPVQSGDLSVSPKPAAAFPDSLTIIWLSVAGIAVFYMCFSYFRLKYSVRNGQKQSEDIFECPNLKTAFVLGYIKPNIYLPQHLDSQDRYYILCHEQMHIARGDNWWKLMGFLCVCLHWYNPVVWVGFLLFCRDIETACDEAVIENIDLQGRKAYSIALLNCGKRLSGYALCPVAFGEISLKQRIKSVLSYKKPTLWITMIAILAAVIIGICFLTSPNYPDITNLEQPQTTVPTTNPTEPITEPSEPVTEPTESPTEAPTDPPAPEPTEAPTELPEEPTVPPTRPPKTETAEESKEFNEAREMALTDDALTRYAASLGFQTLDTHPNTNVKCFSFYEYKSNFWEKGSKLLIDRGKQYVESAYQYCLDKNADVANSIIWVDVQYIFSGSCYRVYIYCATAYSTD